MFSLLIWVKLCCCFYLPVLYLFSGNDKNVALMLESLVLITKPTNVLEQCFRSEGPLGIEMEAFTGLAEWRTRFHEATSPEGMIENVINSVDGFREKLGQYTLALS